MASQQSYLTCTHTIAGGPAFCVSCANLLLREVGTGAVSLSPSQVENIVRYIQAATIHQGQADMATLRGQHPTPQQIYGLDRTVADRVIGNMTPNQLPVSYPYARVYCPSSLGNAGASSTAGAGARVPPPHVSSSSRPPSAGNQPPLSRSAVLGNQQQHKASAQQNMAAQQQARNVINANAGRATYARQVQERQQAMEQQLLGAQDDEHDDDTSSGPDDGEEEEDSDESSSEGDEEE